ncbi:MAG: hypothetical protein C4555_00675 [Dehalococcoidia bacterium]|nr:MAG: hypothetical protein C4555_00675 [Dehalococcoidia bacterium]
MDVVSGERARAVTVEMTLVIEQTGDTVSVEMHKHILSQDPPGLIEGRGEGWKTLKDISSTYTIQRYVYEPVPDGYVEIARYQGLLGAESDLYYWFEGTVSATSMHLNKFTANFNPVTWEQWEFTFTTDQMSGGVKPVVPSDGTFYYGHDSEPNVFVLTRQ